MVEFLSGAKLTIINLIEFEEHVLRLFFKTSISESKELLSSSLPATQLQL